LKRVPAKIYVDEGQKRVSYSKYCLRFMRLISKAIAEVKAAEIEVQNTKVLSDKM
jgi:hypothetical protein